MTKQKQYLIYTLYTTKKENDEKNVFEINKRT